MSEEEFSRIWHGSDSRLYAEASRAREENAALLQEVACLRDGGCPEHPIGGLAARLRTDIERLLILIQIRGREIAATNERRVLVEARESKLRDRLAQLRSESAALATENARLRRLLEGKPHDPHV
jgi:uncharacterized protein involved in exopolysaccharide biosynthesis